MPNEVRSGRTGENTEAFRNSHDRIFGKKDDSKKTLKNKEEKRDVE